MAGTEVMHGVSNMDLRSPKPTWLWPCWVPNVPAAETNTDAAPLTQGGQPATWWQVDYTDLLQLWKGTCSVLNGIDILDSDLPSLHSSLLRKLSSGDLQNTLSTITVCYAALLLVKKLISWQMEWDNGLMLTESTGLTIFPTILT